MTLSLLTWKVFCRRDGDSEVWKNKIFYEFFAFWAAESSIKKKQGGAIKKSMKKKPILSCWIIKRAEREEKVIFHIKSRCVILP